MTFNPHCGCGCRPAGCADGCPCKECQPGPGIDFRTEQIETASRRRKRMQALLRRGDDLTTVEQLELDDLLSVMIHG